ncbi:hypothetical protein [Acuticoccus sp.]|uniref:hypothetical protein n=1 Tax=Acuticoccus sp. TaxID=1904378 RepID=UPI003B523AAE
MVDAVDPGQAIDRTERELHLRKIDAEIAQLNALTAKIIAEATKRMDAEVVRMATDAQKVDAEIAKINTETRLYPLLQGATIVGGLAALVGALAALIKVLTA